MASESSGAEARKGKRWTLVNQRGEVEGSDSDTSSCGSLEVINMEEEQATRTGPSEGQGAGPSKEQDQEDGQHTQEQTMRTSPVSSQTGSDSDGDQGFERLSQERDGVSLPEQPQPTTSTTSSSDEDHSFEAVALNDLSNDDDNAKEGLNLVGEPDDKNLKPDDTEGSDSDNGPPEFLECEHKDDENSVEDSEEDVETLTFEEAGSVSITDKPMTSSQVSAPLSPDEQIRSLSSSLYQRRIRQDVIPDRMRDSDSSDSDFVRLDANMAEEVPLHLNARQNRISISQSSSSSISSRFNFFANVQQPYYRDSDEDDSIPGDVDDRCESDISGIATDDTDMSTLSQLGELPLTEGDVVRSYKHRPNDSLNARLTRLAVLALFTAIGIGIGHFIGSTMDPSMHQEQVSQMHSLQDHYLMCLSKQQQLEIILGKTSSDAVCRQEEHASYLDWRTRYEQLLQEKMATDQQVAELKKVHSQLAVMKLEAQRVTAELDSLQEEHRLDLEALQTNIDGLAERNAELEDEIVKYKGLKVRVEETEAALQQKQKELAQLEMDSAAEILKLGEQLAQVREMKEQEDEQAGDSQPQQPEESSTPIGEHKVLSQTADTGETTRKDDVTNEALLEVERLQTDKSDTEAKLEEKVHENKRLQNELVTAQEQYRQAREQLLLHQGALQESTDKQAKLKTDLRELQEVLLRAQEEIQDVNVDLQDSIIGYPGNVIMNANQEQSGEEGAGTSMNDDVVKLKTTLQEVENKLVLERGRAELWQNLYLTQRSADKGKDSAPSFFTCMGILASSVELNMTELAKAANITLLQNASHFLQTQWNFLQNLTKDTNFRDSFKQKWEHIQNYMNSAVFQEYTDEVKSVFHDLRELFKQVLGSMSEDSSQTSGSTQGENGDQTVTDTLHDTIQKVKDFSRELFHHPAAAIRHIKDSVKTLQDEVKKKWNKMKTKLHSEFQTERPTKKAEEKKDQASHGKGTDKVDQNGEQKSKHKEAHGNNKQPNKHHKTHHVRPDHEPYLHDQHYNFDANRHRWQFEYTAGYQEEPNRNHDDQEKDTPMHDRTMDRIHRETQSDQSSEQVTGDHLGFDPEELLHDGFFEGNHRRWKKYEKNFKKIIGRIRKLNEDSMLTLDEDDIEDIYEDLDDFEDDVEDEELSDKMKNWLTCQIRWWKSRFHRKHRDQNLVKGCGSQLMQWQVTVICKELVKRKGGKSKSVQSEVCKKLLGSQAAAGSGDKRQCQNKAKKNGARSDNIKPGHASISQTPEKYLGPIVDMNMTNADDARWYFEWMQHRENHMHDSRWYLRKMYHQYHPQFHSQYQQMRKDASWFFKRAEDREYHHHKTNWIFNRAAEREYKREDHDNWFLNRGDDRQLHHG